MRRLSIYISLAIIAITICFGQLARRNIVNVKISSIENISDVDKFVSKFECVLGKDNGGIINGANEYIKLAGSYDHIAVVQATGNITMKNRLAREEVEVKKIIKGNKINVGDIIDIQTGDAFSYYNLSKEAIPANESVKLEDKSYVYYTGIINIMQPDYKYLVFFNDIPMVEYSEEKLNLYEAYGTFSRLRLGYEQTNEIIKDIHAEYIFGGLKEYEFFLSDEKLLGEFNSIKNMIISKYDGVPES